MLPILSEMTKNPEPKEDRSCGPHNCLTCPAYAARECDGCTIEYRDYHCNKGVCFQQCIGCAGSGGVNDNTMAACGRSVSMRDTWYKEIGGFTVDWSGLKKQKKLVFETRFIPALHDSWEKIPQYAPDVKTWACSAHKLFGKMGKPVSLDFKDYLGLANDQKLIMTMTMPEDWVEMIWRRNDIGFTEFNVDYWFGSSLSVPFNDCKFMQHLNQKRRIMSVIENNSQFMYYYLGNVKTPSFFKPAVGRVSNIVFDMIMSATAIASSAVIWRPSIRGALMQFGKESSYFFDQINEPEILRAIIGDDIWKILQTRDYHIIGKHWVMFAMNQWGVLDKEQATTIAKTDAHIPRKERAIMNLRTMIDKWDKAAIDRRVTSEHN